jgi:hypothetical protein
VNLPGRTAVLVVRSLAASNRKRKKREHPTDKIAPADRLSQDDLPVISAGRSFQDKFPRRE